MMMIRKTWRIEIGIVAALLIAANTFASSAKAEDVRLSLEWLVSGRHVGFYVAQEKGFYKEEGLNVAIERGYGTADSIKRVATGTADFAILSVASLIAAKAENDPPVRLVGSFFNNGPEAILFLKSSGIKSPKDLAGRRIGSATAGSSFDLLKAFIKSAGVGEVQSIMMASDQTYPALLTKQVDAVTGFTDNAAVMRPIAKQQQNDIGTFSYSDFGVDNYGTGFIVNERRLKMKDPKIREFLRATFKGIVWSISHRKEAAVILKKSVPTIDIDVALDTWKIDEKLIVTDETRKHGLGYLSKDRMNATYEMAKSYMNVKKPLSLDTVYTIEFIPKIDVP